MDELVDSRSLVTFHHPLIFMTLSDVMDGRGGWVGGRRLMALSPSTNTIHSTQYTVQCTLYTLHSIMYNE